MSDVIATDRVEHGLVLPTPPLRYFSADEHRRPAGARPIGEVHEYLRRQRDNMVYLPMDHLREIDDHGHVNGSALRLSAAAFSDLCRVTKSPASFIRRLGDYDATVAVAVVNSLIAQLRGAEYRMLVNAAEDRIEGLVSQEYADTNNYQVLLTAVDATQLDLTNAWVEGPNMRFTAVSDKLIAEPRKGDVVRYGARFQHGISGDVSYRIAAYAERLICTNGAVATESGMSATVVHRGARFMDDLIAESLRLSDAMSAYRGIMETAANGLLLPEQIVRVRRYLSDPGNGGGVSFDREVVRAAVSEAASEGRQPGEVTLWNFHNGVTVQAHRTQSLQRRERIESVGMDLLLRFAAQVRASDN